MAGINWPDIIDNYGEIVGAAEYPDKWGSGILDVGERIESSSAIIGGMDLDSIMEGGDITAYPSHVDAANIDAPVESYRIIVNGGHPSNKSATTVDKGLRELFHSREYYDVVKRKPRPRAPRSRVKWLKKSKQTTKKRAKTIREIIGGDESSESDSAPDLISEDVSEDNSEGVSEAVSEDNSEDNYDSAEDNYDSAEDNYDSAEDEPADVSSADTSIAAIADGTAPNYYHHVDESSPDEHAPTELNESIADNEAYVLTPGMCEIIGMPNMTGGAGIP